MVNQIPLRVSQPTISRVQPSTRIVLKPLKKKRSKVIRILTSPKTTVALGAGLLALAAPIATAGFLARTALGAVRFTIQKPIKALGIALAAPVVGGIVVAAPRLLLPTTRFKAGKQIPGIVEDPSKLKELFTPKTAAITAAGVTAATIGGVVVAKKIRARAKDVSLPSLPIPAAPAALTSIPAAVATAPEIEAAPIGAVQVPQEVPVVAVEKPVRERKQRPIRINNVVQIQNIMAKL